MKRTSQINYYGMGLSRTGTKSLYTAFDEMGFCSKHYMMGFDIKAIAKYDFMCDVPIPIHFEELDEAYPGSKFIYTIRDMEPWLASCSYHLAKKKRVLRKHQFITRIALYGTHKYEREKFMTVYKKHDDRVKAYFKDRPSDLLTIDICNGEGWDKLIPFVGEENIPAKNFSYDGKAFPHINKGRKYTVVA